MALNNLLNSTLVLLTAVDPEAETALPALRDRFIDWHNSLWSLANCPALPVINQEHVRTVLEKAKELMAEVQESTFLKEEHIANAKRLMEAEAPSALVALLRATHMLANSAFAQASQPAESMSEADWALVGTAFAPMDYLTKRLHPPAAAGRGDGVVFCRMQ
ncbi:hypothetical protein EBZ39_18570 [bacterium]|nr:hypothetical protein [bacterium]